MSYEFEMFLQKLGIEHRRSSVQWKNGEAESCHQRESWCATQGGENVHGCSMNDTANIPIDTTRTDDRDETGTQVDISKIIRHLK